MKNSPHSLLLAVVFLFAGISLSHALDVTARYFRFTQTKLRDGASANSIQISEFDLLFQGTRLTGATATNPGGSSPVGQAPAQAVDGSVTTKWLDFNKKALVLTFPAAVTADGYRFATGGDATERDPVSWTIESSADNVTWDPVETKTDYPTPVGRSTYTPNILFQSEVPLTILNFTPDRPKIGTGEAANLIWSVVGSTSVTIDNGIGAVSESGSLPVTPNADTTYTLTASKGASTLTAQATVKVITTGPHTFRYFRFTPLTLRGALANSIQLAEFQMIRSGVTVPGAVATNPGGSSPAGQTPVFAVDGLTSTKWLDFNKAPLVLTFPAPVEVDAYRFATANDFDERDPISWTLEGSADGTSWTLMDSVTSFPTPLTRLGYTGNVPLPAVLPPSILSFTVSPVHLQSGESTTLTWTTDFATSVQIAPAVTGSIGINGSVQVTPTGPTTYTLTATNVTGTTTRTVQVQVESPALQVAWKYFRFTPTTLRNGTLADSVQISEFEVSLGGVAYTGATATNPGGNNPAGEPPAMAADGNLTTKWLDYNKKALVLAFPSTVTIDGYRIGTADDAPERDPVAWTFEGSDDGATWSIIDTRNIGYVIPAARSAYTSYFRFPGTTGVDFIANITGSAFDTGGQNLTITWDSEAGRSYRVEQSTDLDAWQIAVPNVSSAGLTTSVSVPLNGSLRSFFQIVRKP